MGRGQQTQADRNVLYGRGFVKGTPVSLVTGTHTHWLGLHGDWLIKELKAHNNDKPVNVGKMKGLIEDIKTEIDDDAFFRELSIMRLREEVKPLVSRWPESIKESTRDLIGAVVKCMEDDLDPDELQALQDSTLATAKTLFEECGNRIVQAQKDNNEEQGRAYRSAEAAIFCCQNMLEDEANQELICGWAWQANMSFYGKDLRSLKAMREYNLLVRAEVERFTLLLSEAQK